MNNRLPMQLLFTYPSLLNALYTVLLSFVLAMLVAVVYEKTFKGISYSRNYVQSLVLSAIIAATIMQAIGDSLAHGLGMMGALSIVRFRTSFKDSRDIIFMFAALAVGVGCGVNAYAIAVIGTLGFCVAATVLCLSPFGQTSYFDGMLRFNMENTPEDRGLLENILREYCDKFALITLQDMAQGRRLDYAYHVKLKKRLPRDEFLERLKEIRTIKGVNLMLQETTIEL